MRILWACTPRMERIADHFGPFRRAVSAMADVDVVVRPLPDGLHEGDLCRKACFEGYTMKPLIDPAVANEYDLVVCDSLSAFLDERWAEIRVPKLAIWGDCHGSMVAHYMRLYRYEFEFDIFCPMFREGCETFCDYLYDREVVWLPWSVPGMFRPGRRTQDVTLFGDCDQAIHPLRHEAARVCAGEPWFERVRKPDLRDPDDRHMTGAVYAAKLGGSRMSLTDVSKYNYVRSSHLEIAASTVLITDWCRDLGDMGFEDGVNCLIVPDLRGLRDRLYHWVQTDLEVIAASGRALVHTRHTNGVRAHSFVAFMEKRLRIAA